MTATTLELKDTFNEWRTKINAMVNTINDSETKIDDIKNKSQFNLAGFSNLTVNMLGGRLRDGSMIEVIQPTSLAVFPQSLNIVCIYKKPNVPASLVVYKIADVPQQYIIPLFAVWANAAITTVDDLRTEYNTASGSSASATSVLFFDKFVEENITIPAGRNGLSVDPVVNQGITVTVAQGSTWVIV